MKIDKSDHYFGASLERMSQAWTLDQEGNSYALALYVAGVAVECMLRAFKMRRETTFDEKHDPGRLFRASGMLKVDPELLKANGLSEGQAQVHFRGLQAAMVDVCRLWAYDDRYASEARMRAHLKQRKLDRGEGRLPQGEGAVTSRRISTGHRQRGLPMELVGKIQALLTKAFPPPDKVRLDENDGIYGTITSNRFEGMETIDRINMIWDILDHGLTAEERRQILMIIPATTEEETAYTA